MSRSFRREMLATIGKFLNLRFQARSIGRLSSAALFQAGQIGTESRMLLGSAREFDCKPRQFFTRRFECLSCLTALFCLR